MSRPKAKNAPRESTAGLIADSPAEIPLHTWPQILIRVGKSFSEHGLSLIAAGIAFYTFLGIFPALAALVSIYGFFVDPASLESQISTYLGALPFEVREIFAMELKRISASGVAGWAGIIASAIALWGGSKSAAAFMQGMNVVYRERDHRGIIKSRATALLLTCGVLLMVLFGFALLAGIPYLMKTVNLGERWIETMLLILRWPLFVLLLLISLAFLYRAGPDRENAKWRWITVGAVVAAVLIVLATWVFGALIAHFGNYNATYGSLGAVVVLLLWLQMVSIGILFGGLLNAQMEFQTVVDSTTGEPKPMGERGAFMADHAPPQ